LISGAGGEGTLKVRDVIVSDINSVSPSTPVIEVAHQMDVSGRGVISICDKDRFRGLITERDIVVNVVARARDPVTEPASSIMNERLPIVSPDDDIMEAVKVMGNSGVRALPVVQIRKLVGLFTIEELARENQALAAMVLVKSMKSQVRS